MDTTRSTPKPVHYGPPPRGRQTLLWVAFLAFSGALAAGAQTVYILQTGSELCIGQGCALVGNLTRIPPVLFNLFGAGVFGVVGITALGLRRHWEPRTAALLQALLVAAFGAEGVLFAYQWQVAGAWCIYCLCLLAVVATLNLLYAGRDALYGLAAFAASVTIFSMLSFIPHNKTLADGTFAIRPAEEGPSFYLIFAEDCPHCREVEEAVARTRRCTVRFNPVSRIPVDFLPDLERTGIYDPRVNLAVATMLGLRAVPILVAEEHGGQRILTGSEAILDYIDGACGDAPEPPGIELNPLQLGSPLGLDDGCGLQVDCD